MMKTEDRLREALNVKTASMETLNKTSETDSLVTAWHGTNAFWTLWFCLYGIDATIAPPTKALGRGNDIDGYSLIKDPGLYVSAARTSGFTHYVCLDVKPSELAISYEMKELGYENVLQTLKSGDCIVSAKLPAKRIVKVRANNQEYSRAEFIATFPDPLKYLQELHSVNMYHQDDNVLLHRASLNFMFRDFKDNCKSLDEVNSALDDAIRFKDYLAWGLKEEDISLFRTWAEKYFSRRESGLRESQNPWLGSSVVKNIVYHGTDATFSEFKPKTGRDRQTNKQLDFGSHFTEDKAHAMVYTRSGKIVKAYIRLERPLDLTTGGNWFAYRGDRSFDALEAMYKSLKLTPRGDCFYDKTGTKRDEVQNYFVNQHILDSKPPAKARQAIIDAGFDGVIYEPYEVSNVAYRQMIEKRPRSFIVFASDQVKIVDD